MDALSRAVLLAQIVARNVVPLVGILHDGWSPGNVMLLYLWDTMLSLGVVFAGIAQSMMTGSEKANQTRLQVALTPIVVAMLLCAVFVVPLGMPIFIALAASDFKLGAALHDRSLWIGVLVQCAIAAWSYRTLFRALRTHTPGELRLKQRFGLVLMRWVAVLAACYFLLQFGAGRLVLIAIVAAYAVASIVAEVAPDLLLRGTPADEPELSPDADSAGKPRHVRDRRQA